MTRQRALRLAISLLLVVPFALHATGMLRFNALDQAENLAYDLRLNLTLPRSVDDRIVIIDIDEASLADIGRWPWPRDQLAQLVDQLFERYRIDTLGFDVVFAERNTSAYPNELRRLAESALADQVELLEALETIAPELQQESRFADALRGRNVVLGYFFRQTVDPEDGSGTSGVLPPSMASAGQTKLDGLPIPRPAGYGGNLPELQEAARGGGFFDNPLVSQDGVFRRVPLLQAYDDELYELLALQTARAALDWPELELIVGEDPGANYRAVEGIRLGDRVIPVDRNSAVPVPYLGRQGSFPYVSAHDVIRGEVDREVLEDRIALVGTTAAGLFDLRTAPMQRVYPGVEIHANVIAGILDERIRQEPAYLLAVEFLLVILLGAGMTVLLPLLSPLWLSVTTVAVTGALLAGNLALWSGAGLIIPLASPFILLLILFVFHVSWGFFVETRGKRELSRLFGQYVPPELVEEMDQAPEQITLHGESREMTVLFSDIRGFTSISEDLDPQELTRLMNAFLTPMTRVIHDHRGTIDKYMGDAIMAFWGAPLNDPEHPKHALLAAFDMIRMLEELSARFEREGWPRLDIGIGVNTGVMSVGNMGSEFRMAYTVLGDAVNLGSRLEGLTKTYGARIICAESTRDAVPELEYRELDIVRVKGKDRPVAIFEPIGPVDEIPRDQRRELRRYHAALRQYRQRQWDDAERELFSLSREHPERSIYRLYMDRIAVFRNTPPPDDWDGVFTHLGK